MMRSFTGFGWATAMVAVLSLGSLSLAGCNTQPAADAPSPDAHEAHDEHAGHDHGHEHGAHGPHDGELIELGDGEYHGELIHNADEVTIYILDGAAKNTVPIDAAEITINLMQDGKPAQFTLAAAPQEGDGEGKSSRFHSDDADLAGLLLEDSSEAKLLLTIDGTSYNSPIHHSHDHDH